MLLGVVLAAAPAAGADRAHAHQLTRDQCLLWGADRANPWALAHGITTFGPDFLANDGRKAIDVIVGDFVLRNRLPDGGAAPGSPFAFQRFALDGTPVEPHANLITKTLVGAGVPRATAFKTSWGSVTLQQLVDSARFGFRHVPQSEDYWRDAAWTIDLFQMLAKPGDTFKTGDGQTISVDALMDDALVYLEKATADLKAGLEKGLPEVPKRKQGVYGHPCGGQHLVQAVLGWARHPQVRKRWGRRVDTQVAILFYRLESERRQYEAVIQQAPQHKLQILVQQLKFYGHLLETFGRLKQDLGFKPDDAQQLSLNRTRALLDATVRELEGLKAFTSMERIRSNQKQLYLDLIGDSCHAAHGFDAWP